MERYNELMQAIAVLRNARNATEVNGLWNNPAWNMVHHAMRHLEAQAEYAMRSGA